jgi:nitroreductase
MSDPHPNRRTDDSADAGTRDIALAIESVIHRRGSSLLVDPEASVDEDLLRRLLRAAQAAPNHKTTRPMRAAVVRGEARRRLGEAVANAMETRGDAPERVTKTRTKYTRAPVVIVVGSAPGASEHETSENDLAVAAGIQNLLLLAEAAGLACLWSSPAKGADTAIARVCGFDADVKVIGLVYVGWPTRERDPKPRPEPSVNWID